MLVSSDLLYRADAGSFCADNLRRGGAVHLLGPSGSGKTRALKEAAEISAPEARIGFCPENAVETLRAGDVNEALERDDFENCPVVGILGLKPFRQRPLRELSHGERQKVALARALNPKTDMAILDEPGRHLDPGGRKEAVRAVGIWKSLSGRRKKGLLVAETRPHLPELLFSLEGRMAGSSGSVRAVDRKDEIPGLLLELFNGKKCRLDCRSEHGAGFGSPVLCLDGLVCRLLKKSSPLTGEFKTGRVHAVDGGMGSGKTTLLRTLAGLIKPHEGNFKLMTGRAPGSLSGKGSDDTKRAGRNKGEKPGVVGYVGAEPVLGLFEPAVLSELGLGAHKEVSVDAALEFFRICAGRSVPADQNPMNLTRADKTFLALTTMLVKRPHMVLLDEPTAGLDLEGVEFMGMLLSGLSRWCVVLAATHDPVLKRIMHSGLDLDEANQNSGFGFLPASDPEAVES